MEPGSLDGRIRAAIATRHLVEFRYSGVTRVAEPHDYGIQGDRVRLLVFQLRGPAQPGRSAIGWRLLDVARVDALQILDETFAGSRGHSHHHHYRWDTLYARVT